MVAHGARITEIKTPTIGGRNKADSKTSILQPLVAELSAGTKTAILPPLVAEISWSKIVVIMQN
jgi:hypothetical protein